MAKRYLALLLVVLGAALLTPAALAGLFFVRDTKKRRWLKVAAIVGLVPYITFFYARFVEPKTLTVQRADIVSATWMSDPIRIGIITDTHVGGPHVSAVRVESIVARMNAEKPDIVVLLGDFSNGRLPAAERTPADRAEVEKGIAAFADLKAPKGVYAAIGNNDVRYDEAEVRAALERVHVVVLQNAAAPIPGLKAYVAGVDEFGDGHANVPKALSSVPAEASVITIMHFPDSFAVMPPRVALSLAGHSHCGQVGLPFADKFLNASDGSGRWRCHYYNTDGRNFFVSGGIGTSVLPMRLLAPPEIDVLTLRGK
ncbi:MAG: metallophosphoesterase [Alphaproteobacteria bacterium]